VNRQRQIEQFAKLSSYILGRRPDEFGLVPDSDGYIKIKEFLQAISETDGWKFIRISHINEMMMVVSDPPIEIKDTLIRARDRNHLGQYLPTDTPPKLLYIYIKKKSYPGVLENGIKPTFHPKVICSDSQEMALRIGKRRDIQPVLLTVQVKKSLDNGVLFSHDGGLLYLAQHIPLGCFSGPPLPKEHLIDTRRDKKPDPVEIHKQKTQTGTFALKPPVKGKGKKYEKDDSWKKNKKRLRREKKHRWPGE